jgi:hypothetical protein
VQVAPMPHACFSVDVVGRSRKYPLPAPLTAGIWILPAQSIRQRRLPQSVLQIDIMLLAHTTQVILERLEQVAWQHR